MRIAVAIIFLLLISGVALASIDPEIEKALESRQHVKVIITEKRTGSIGIQEMRKVSERNFLAVVDSDKFKALKNNLNVDVALVPIVVPFLTESTALINATNVWNLSAAGTKINGTGETVCVIDSGVNASHPNFNGKVISGYSYCADEGCTTEGTNFNDALGHGTHVAGIIASENETYRGVAPGA
ncbi:MAG: S8 family serine peptidase, partial [Candidatus Aenigmarchaeota archaeon]|nr:S8 family serine peptidase [Candidatus Aenigmarchaeota archaeon]MDI6722067.1 S8 family serine peptidase [Candidatus Aenigmarchaeota archaeon]